MDPSWVIAACAVATCVLTIFLQWVRYENRLTEVKGETETALQVGAEVEQKCKELEKMVGNLRQDSIDARDRMRREFGETVKAMQHKIHEFETWSRDEFVKKTSLESMITRMEKAQETRDQRFERQLDAIIKRLDDQAKLVADAAAASKRGHD